MSNDQTAALQALLQQVQSLTETVEKQQSQFDGMRKHNERLLDRLQDKKRASSNDPHFDKLEQEHEQRSLDALGLERMPGGALKLKSGPGDSTYHFISREDARDSQNYRDAKAAAQAAGLELRVLADGEDPTRRNMGRPETVQTLVFTFDDDHERIRYVRSDMNTGRGLVNRRLQAERDGFTIKTFNSIDDLPDHARTKFNLMEKAAQNVQTE